MGGFKCMVLGCPRYAAIYRRGLRNQFGEDSNAPVCRAHAKALDRGQTMALKKKRGRWGQPIVKEEVSDE